MKSLDTIQKIAKAAYVLTRIAFVFCIVGLVLCLVGIVSVLIAGFEPIRIGSVTLHSIGDAETDLSLESMMLSMVIASLKRRSKIQYSNVRFNESYHQSSNLHYYTAYKQKLKSAFNQK